MESSGHKRTNTSISSRGALSEVVPRTPHSTRWGSTSNARHPNDAWQVDMEGGDAQELEIMPTEPLLGSNASTSYPKPARPQHSRPYSERDSSPSQSKGYSPTVFGVTLPQLMSRIPLVIGSIAAVFLFFLVVLSYRRPDVLKQVIGEPEAPTWDEDYDDRVVVKIPPVVNANESHPHVIDYSNYTRFPLLPKEYAGECWKIVKMGHGHGDYWQVPNNGVADVPHKDASGVCESTITYMLDGYVGLMADLALMAQVAGFAREQNRTFLVNDRFWNRGKWTDHFLDVRTTQPGPDPSCLPPPPQELVACPRLAKHWVVNSRTAKFHFGHEFSNEFEDPYAVGLPRQRNIFNRARESMFDTFVPNERTARAIRKARVELSESLPQREYMGVHVRRGDQKASSWKYHNTYVPLADYVEFGRKSWPKLAGEDLPVDSHFAVYVGSDSPPAITELVKLAGVGRVFALMSSTSSELESLASPEEYSQGDWMEWSRQSRIELTRGMIVDFALLSGAWRESDTDLEPVGTVCTISSNTCKLAATILGWKHAFEEGAWVEVDARGSVEPIWEGFQMY